MLTCSKCQYPFKFGTPLVCDSCEAGFEYLDGYCMKPLGCISFLPDYSKCLACYSKYHFVYDSVSNLCLCDTGYKLVDYSNTKICKSQCGNGYLSEPY